MMLEDKHIQLTMDKSLMNYDLILRTNDNGTKYIAFDIFDYDKQQIIKTIKINEGNNNNETLTNKRKKYKKVY